MISSFLQDSELFISRLLKVDFTIGLCSKDFIERRLYRRKYDAEKTLAAFGARLRDGTRLEALVPALLGAVQDSLQPEQAWLWLKER